MALTADVKIVQFGVPGNADQPLTKGIKASAQLYRGSIAVTDNTGYLVNPATSGATSNVCWGLIEGAGAGTADSGPGITGGSANGSVSANIRTGTFFLASGTGADQLSVATEGQKVYVIDEVTVGATDGNLHNRAIAGTHIATDTTQPGGYAIRLGNNESSGSV